MRDKLPKQVRGVVSRAMARGEIIDADSFAHGYCEDFRPRASAASCRTFAAMLKQYMDGEPTNLEARVAVEQELDDIIQKEYGNW